MTANHIKSEVIDLYDQFVKENQGDEGVKVAEAKDGIREAVIEIIRATDRDIDAEADAVINATISSERGRRSRSLKKNLDYLIDGFSEEGTYVDPILDLAFSLGDEAGIDKTLREWTVEDFDYLTVTRYRVAAEATKASQEFDLAAQRVVSRMRAEGAHTVGDVNWWLQ